MITLRYNSIDDYKKYCSLLNRKQLHREQRRIRSVIWDIVGTKEEDNLLPYLHKQLDVTRECLKTIPHNEPVGQYSGLTRKELAKTGLYETDFY